MSILSMANIYDNNIQVDAAWGDKSVYNVQ
jgi:hypothetical protein